MASRLESRAPPVGGPDVRLPDAARTVISLLLFVHLFGLGLVFFSNFEGGDWDSTLLYNMKRVVRPYMYPLWLDRPYHYHLTYAEELDFDHYIEGALTPADSSEAITIRLPDDELGPGLRRQRYQRLAWHFARRAQSDASSEVLPLAIGAGLLKQNHAARVQVRCLRKRPLFLDEVRAGTPRNVPDERIYAADVFFLPGFDQPQLNKIGEARDVAPVTRPSDSGSQGRGAREDQKSSSGGPDRTAPLRNPLTPPGDGSRSRPPALPPDQ